MAEPSTRRPVLLLVDDDPFSLMMLENIVATVGTFDTATSSSGAAVLARLAEPAHAAEPIAGIMLDLYLGDMTGPELLRELRDRHPWVSAPVIIVSGDEPDPAKQPAMHTLGVVAFWSKPVSTAQVHTLAAAVSKAGGDHTQLRHLLQPEASTTL